MDINQRLARFMEEYGDVQHGSRHEDAYIEHLARDALAKIEHLSAGIGVCKVEISRLEKLVASLRAELDEWERGITRYVGNP
jgi:hemerythrin-like domain-containing protein